jgi:hypothetical protein
MIAPSVAESWQWAATDSAAASLPWWLLAADNPVPAPTPLANLIEGHEAASCVS